MQSETELYLKTLASDKLEAFTGTIRPDGTYKDEIYKGSRKTAAQIASDYGRRFMVELIQNAYDALPGNTSSGRIKIVFAPEDEEQGVLYVCNSGQGFQPKNVQALCNMGLSSKPAGEAIGNKGLGFRSVTFISDEPRIFSASSPGKVARFDGFCFRFARDADFKELLESPRHAELAAKDLPPFHVPIPIKKISDRVINFGKDGYVTVVALPLRDANAALIVREEMEALRSHDVPLLLFLPKITKLEVQITNDDEGSFVRKRKARRILEADVGERKHCLLGVNLTGHGRFLICMTTIKHDEVLDVIDQSIQRNELHPDWRDWEGEGEVACAVRIDDGPVEPRLYTFLPMGEQAEAPIHGYVHGSFFPKADRASLNASIPLNALYLREGLRLTAWAVKALGDAQYEDDITGNLTFKERGSAIIDFMCWRAVGSIKGNAIQDYVEAMPKALNALDIDLDGNNFLPALGIDLTPGWSSLAKLKRWRADGSRALSTANLVKLAKLSIAPADLGEERLDRLENFAAELDGDYTLDIDESVLADAAEAIAVAWVERSADSTEWEEFYLELLEHFENQGWHLRDRRILLCQDGQLRKARALTSDTDDQDKPKGRRKIREHMSVFSPPRRLAKSLDDKDELAELLHIPDILQDGFAFLSDRLNWAKRLNSVIVMLEDQNLIYAYDASDIVSHLARLVKSDSRKGFRRAALTWVFRLYGASKHAGRPFSVANAGLYVPLIDGRWVRASEAFFSKSWPSESLGKNLVHLLDHSDAKSQDLEVIRKQLLSDAGTGFGNHESVGDWYDFLKELGVKRGLQARQEDSPNFRISGKELDVTELSQRFEMGRNTQAVWQSAVEQWGESQKYFDTLHRIDGHIWYMPGQEEFEGFLPDVKALYAGLLIDWMAQADDEVTQCVFYSDSFHNASRFRWPTPIGAFLKIVDWLPHAIREEQGRDIYFSRPAESWVPDYERTDRLPGYMPSLLRPVNDALRRNWIEITRLIEWTGARIFDRPDDLLAQVVEMGFTFHVGRIDRYYLQPFMNDYIKAWGRLVQRESTLEWPDVEKVHLVVRRSGGVEALEVPLRKIGNEVDEANQHDAETCTNRIYVHDIRGSLEAQLLESLGEAVFDIENPGRVNNLKTEFESHLDAKFEYVSDVHIDTFVDGEHLSSGIEEQSVYLVDRCRWLPMLVSLVMESLKGVAAQRLPADRSVIIDRLHAIRLHLGQQVGFVIDGRPVQLPEDSRGTLDINDNNGLLLIVETPLSLLDWNTLARVSPGICRLLGHDDLGAGLKLTMRMLEGLGEQLSGPKSSCARLEELAAELGLSTTHLDVVARIASGNLEFLLQRIRPVIHYHGGLDLLIRFDSLDSELEQLTDLSTALADIFDFDAGEVSKIVEACREALGPDEVRRRLELDFAKFNQSLVAVNEEPITFPLQHAHTLSSFVEVQRDVLMDSMRARFVADFDAGLPLTHYMALRGSTLR